MRVAINTLSVTEDNEGIRTMAVGLVGALVRLDSVNQYRLITSLNNQSLFADLPAAVTTTVIRQQRRRPLVRIAHDQTSVPWAVRRGTDILLTLSSVGSLVAPVPQIVVVVAHLALPSVRQDAGGEQLSMVHRAYYGPIMRFSHRRAHAIVTISQFLADRLVADTSVAPAKVHAILCGIDPMAPLPPTAPGGEPYVLFVSTLYPYKNADAVIRGLAEAKPRLSEKLTAVIVGRDPDGAQVASLRRLAETLGVTDDVVITGKVSEQERDRLYAGARAMIFPSRAEGFGFAPLEAMARGIPVIVSNRTSLPEVVGDAGLLVDPDRPQELADALVGLMSDPALRSKLATAGLVRASELSWDRAARSFIDLFANVSATTGLRSHRTRSNTP